MEKSPFVRTAQGAAQPQNQGGGTLTGAVRPQVSVVGGREDSKPQALTGQRGSPMQSGTAAGPLRPTGGVLRGTLRTGTPPVMAASAPVTAAVQSGSFRRSEGPATDGTAAEAMYSRRPATDEPQATQPTGRSDKPCSETGLAAARHSTAKTEGHSAADRIQAAGTVFHPGGNTARSAEDPGGTEGAEQAVSSADDKGKNRPGRFADKPDLTAAFAAAEQARLAALRSGGADPTGDDTGDASPLPGAVLGRAELRTRTAAGDDNDRPKPAARPTDSELTENQPSFAGRQDLAAAFAAAEQARLAALRSGGADPTGDDTGNASPLPGAAPGRAACAARSCRDRRCADAPTPDYDALDAALLRGIGWGSEAGSTLTNSTASALLLDWGEENRAAHQSQRALTAHIRGWLDDLDRIDRLNLYENWPRIARHADELVRSTLPSSGRLNDAGSPNRRTDYSPVHWAAVKQAVEQALNGTEENESL